MNAIIRLSLVAGVIALTGCAKPLAPKDYTAFQQAAPRSILIAPVVNRTTQVDAPDNFLVTLSTPLAEHGYYVFPVNMVKHTMDDDGLSDADFVAQSDPTRLAGLFGADAILYASIEHWDARYVLLSTTTIVDVHYVLKSGRTGQTLWDREVHLQYSPQAAGSGNIVAALVADAITAAIERAHPSYMPLAARVNSVAFNTKGQGILAGPYDPNFGKNP